MQNCILNISMYAFELKIVWKADVSVLVKIDLKKIPTKMRKLKMVYNPWKKD